MLYKSSTLVLFMLVSRFLPAQHDTGSDRTDYDYQKFKQTYDKEVVNDTIIPQKTILHPASVPDVISNIPLSDSKTIYAVGISDPGMEFESAKKLALFRAKTLIAFTLFPEIAVIIDNYSNEKQENGSSKFTTRYSDFYQLRSVLPFDSTSFNVLKFETTSFQEVVVLMSYTIQNEKSGDYILAEANVYQNERQKQKRFYSEGKFKIIGVEKINLLSTFSTSYDVTSLNNSSQIQSTVNQQPIEFPYNNYRYVSDSSENNIKTLGSKLTYGLWKAYSEQFMKKICQLSENTDVEIKQVDDDYNAGKQSLSRELQRSNLNFRLTAVKINDNRLSVEVNPIK